MAGYGPQLHGSRSWRELNEEAEREVCGPGDADRSDSAGSGRGRRADRLERTIEGEIIPRLMLAHRAVPHVLAYADGGERQPDADDVIELTRMVLGQDVAVARSFVEELRRQGASLDRIFLDLMAPTARLLGDLWKADLSDFTDVTLALSRLQQLLREYGPTFEAEGDVGGQGRRVMLVAAPGDQHSFGIFIVEEFFRRAGWDVWGGPPATVGDLCALVGREWFAVVGFSLSRESLLDELASAIRSVRKESCNRSVGIMVGGRVFVEHPELALRVGADATAGDARGAILQAESLAVMSEKRC